MFELPEFVTLARQMNDTLKGKTIQRGQLGNSPHKFVWYNRSHDEFERLTKGRAVGEAWAKGKWLFIPLEPGYVLLLGECGGKVLYHPPGSKVPKKYHLYITFEDGSFLAAATRLWGAMELYENVLLFRARLHPRHPIADLSTGQRRALYQAIVDIIDEVIEKGGRCDEYDLHNHRGGYVRLMDKNAVGRPCPECGGEIEKIQYLGGACYFCPSCQE